MAAARPVIDVSDVSRTYGATLALDGVSLRVGRGEIHALLGRNGAGKTTLIRLLSGLVDPTTGTCSLAGVDVRNSLRATKRLVGLVPSGDRSFYMRLSALENLIFFGRLHGLSKRAARDRSLVLLREVGLGGVVSQRMNTYSHGMQKRVSVARGLLVDPPILLVDEATHDLDPEGAVDIRDLVRRAAADGAAVLWATQRVEEIRGFADEVTLLELGRTRFQGTVPELLARAGGRRFVLELAVNGAGTMPSTDDLVRALAQRGRIAPSGGDTTYLLALAEGETLGDALSALMATGVVLTACRSERPEVEDAFLTLVSEEGT